MTLKDAFRYQKFLKETVDTTLYHLRDTAITTKTTSIHKLCEVDAVLTDKIEVSTDSRTFGYTADQLVAFLSFLLEERSKVSEAISISKRYHTVDIDANIAENKILRNVASALRDLDRLKTTKRTSVGSAYRFNAEGNQIPCRYNIESVTEIDFDRKTVKSMYKKLYSDADERSAAVDDALLSLRVLHEPALNINDSFEDMLDAFLLSEK